MPSRVPPGSEAVLEAVDAAIAELKALRGALIPILHAISERLGFVPPAAIARIAQALNITQAEVHGVITFYHDFRTTPPGDHVLKLCRAEACQAMGCERLERRLREHYGLGMKETSPDGRLTVEPVYCLGNCALSPAVMLDGRLQGRVDEKRLDELLAGAVPGGAVHGGRR